MQNYPSSVDGSGLNAKQKKNQTISSIFENIVTFLGTRRRTLAN